MSDSEWLSMEDMFSASNFAIITHVDYTDEALDLLESKHFPLYFLEFGPRIDIEGKENGLFKKIEYHETQIFSKIYTLKSHVKHLYKTEPMFFSKKKENDFEIECDSCVERIVEIHDLKKEIDELRYKCRHYERVIESLQNGTVTVLGRDDRQKTAGDCESSSQTGRPMESDLSLRSGQTASAMAAREKKTAERWSENLHACVRLALWSKEQANQGLLTTKKERTEWLRENDLPRLLDSAERKFCQAMNEQAPGTIR